MILNKFYLHRNDTGGCRFRSVGGELRKMLGIGVSSGCGAS